MMRRALRSSSRSRAFSRSSFRTFLASRFPSEGLGPRFFASPLSDPSRAAFRHDDRCELYSPSRRSNSPISPGVSQASACSTIESLYAAVKRRRVAFADTSGSGPAAALRLPSPEGSGVPFTFIPSPRAILHLSASPYSNLSLLSCLASVGREGWETARTHFLLDPSLSLVSLVSTKIEGLGKPFNTVLLRRLLEPGQYTSVAFGERCRASGIAQSMGSVGSAYDNAMCESFFATLECELIWRHSFRSAAEARREVFGFIEGFYNTRRLHSALGYESPVDYERNHAA